MSAGDDQPERSGASKTKLRQRYVEVRLDAARTDVAAEIVVAGGRDRKVTGGVLDGGGANRLFVVNGPSSRLRLFSVVLKNGLAAGAAGSGGAVRARVHR